MVSSSLFVSEESEQKKVRSPLSTYTEVFYDVFPRYLAMGMTYDQFWNDDPMLAKYYREAEEIRKEIRNQELWLQGLYVYEAISDLSPILHAFAKKGTKPHPYPDSPVPITKKEIERVKEEKEKQEFEKGKRFMESLTQQTNAKYKEAE